MFVVSNTVKKFTVSMNEKFKNLQLLPQNTVGKPAFIEVTYQDGFVQSTPNVILPKEKFPTKLRQIKVISVMFYL